MIHRRELFHSAVTLGAASVLSHGLSQAEETENESRVIVDTNVSLFQWPFRRLPLDQPDALTSKMRALGIAKAWTGSFEGILHRDITSVNQRLVESCRRLPELIPIGSVNPMLPGWEMDLRVCFDQHAMPGIRLHPNYHGYTLTDPVFGKLLKLASAARGLVQVAVAMEDTRTQHPLVQVPDVDLGMLPQVMGSFPDARIQLLNYRPKPGELEMLAKVPNLSFDTARVESTDGIATLLRAIPAERVMLGTHAPFLIPEAALIRVGESNLSDQALQSLLWKSSQTWLS